MSSETLKHVRHVLSENPVTMAAAALFALFILLALIGPAIVPHDPLATTMRSKLTPRSKLCTAISCAHAT